MSDDAGRWQARLRLDPTAFVAPGAIVVGDVTLGARASVWFNTVVRGDTDRIEIGDDTNVQDNSTVHVDHGEPALVGVRVTVGHRAIVHGCRVEDDVLIGMGAVVLSGARIGTGSLIGAAALVREGQTIPPGSLALGAPARVIGPCTEAHREAIRRGAAHYAELAASYRARGFARAHADANSDAGMTDRVPAPMTHEEWTRLVAVLEASPRWVAGQLEAAGEARFATRSAEGRWSAHEAACHLRDGDAHVFGPRLERLERGDGAWFPVVDLPAFARDAAYAVERPAVVLEAWRAYRAALVARLARFGPADWARWGTHERLGPWTLAEMARRWVEHDLSHRRQIASALESCA